MKMLCIAAFTIASFATATTSQTYNVKTFKNNENSATIFEITYDNRNDSISLNHESTISKVLIIYSEQIAITISAAKAIIWSIRTGDKIEELLPGESASILPQSMTPNIKITFTENSEIKITEDEF